MDTNYKKEIIGGITTFLSMAYILAVNPQVLSLAGVKGISGDMKMDQGAIFVATALAQPCRIFIHGTYCKNIRLRLRQGWG